MANDTSQAQIAATTLVAPAPNPKNVEATTYYVFNETGNIMMASTIDTNSEIPEEVRELFAEVAVFFAGMTRAMATTTNPDTKQPYSLYNYNALQNVIDGSGLFVHVTEEDVQYKTTKMGAEFSQDLVQALLGLATGTGELNFAAAMVQSIGNEAINIGATTSTTNSKVGNIVFVCEYLLGMPMVSAIVVYVDASKNQTVFNVGPCIKGGSTHIQMTLHKDTYMFVTPKFIKKYAGDLDSINRDPEYLEMINWLSGLLLATPTIFDLVDVENNFSVVPNNGVLTVGNAYALQGQFFPPNTTATPITLSFDTGSGTPPVIDVTGASVDEITFTIKSGTLDTPAPITLKGGDNNSVNIVSTTAVTVVAAAQQGGKNQDG